MAKILSKKAILENISMNKCIDAVEDAYKNIDRYVFSNREFVKTKDGGDYLITATSNMEKETYIVRGSSFMPWKKKIGETVVTGYYMYQSFDTGEMLAFVNGTDLIKFRTAAKSAVAAKHVAKKDSKTLGLIGMGGQMPYQSEAIASVLPIERIIGWSPNAKSRINEQEMIKEKSGIEVEILEKEDVIKQADIIVVATQSKESLFDFDMLSQGQTVLNLDHVTSTGIDLTTNADKVFVDRLESAQTEPCPVRAAVDSGKFSFDDVAGSLSELVNGNVHGRDHEEEIIFFQSLGVTHEDMAVIEYLFEDIAKLADEVEI